jgi:hypothetical protein
MATIQDATTTGDDRHPSRGRRSHGARPTAVPPSKDMPSGVRGDIGVFDRFAGAASRFASRAPFFAACVLLVLIWAPTIFVLGDIDTWQLIINTATTIVTFLLVALLQNTQYRADEAVQHKLNAIASGLADLMAHSAGDGELDREIAELADAVGLEERESST